MTTTTVDRDTVEIVDLINLYGFALDAHQWDLFPRIFTEDVIAEFGPAGTEWIGCSTLVAAFKDFHEQLDNHAHTMFGQVVRVNGDKANAFTYGTWMLRRDAAGDDPTWIGNGWYDDELVRTPDGWRISHRICRLVSWTGNPVVSSPERAHNPDMTTNVLRDHVAAGKVMFVESVRAK